MSSENPKQKSAISAKKKGDTVETVSQKTALAASSSAKTSVAKLSKTKTSKSSTENHKVEGSGVSKKSSVKSKAKTSSSTTKAKSTSSTSAANTKSKVRAKVNSRVAKTADSVAVSPKTVDVAKSNALEQATSAAFNDNSLVAGDLGSVKQSTVKRKTKNISSKKDSQSVAAASSDESLQSEVAIDSDGHVAEVLVKKTSVKLRATKKTSSRRNAKAQENALTYADAVVDANHDVAEVADVIVTSDNPDFLAHGDKAQHKVKDKGQDKANVSANIKAKDREQNAATNNFEDVLVVASISDHIDDHDLPIDGTGFIGVPVMPEDDATFSSSLKSSDNKGLMSDDSRLSHKDEHDLHGEHYDESLDFKKLQDDADAAIRTSGGAAFDDEFSKATEEVKAISAEDLEKEIKKSVAKHTKLSKRDKEATTDSLKKAFPSGGLPNMSSVPGLAKNELGKGNKTIDSAKEHAGAHDIKRQDDYKGNVKSSVSTSKVELGDSSHGVLHGDVLQDDALQLDAMHHDALHHDAQHQDTNHQDAEFDSVKNEELSSFFGDVASDGLDEVFSKASSLKSGVKSSFSHKKKHSEQGSTKKTIKKVGVSEVVEDAAKETSKGIKKSSKGVDTLSKIPQKSESFAPSSHGSRGSMSKEARSSLDSGAHAATMFEESLDNNFESDNMELAFDFSQMRAINHSMPDDELNKNSFFFTQKRELKLKNGSLGLEHVNGKSFDLKDLVPDLRLLSKDDQTRAEREYLNSFNHASDRLLACRRLERMGASDYANLTVEELKDLIHETLPQLTEAKIADLVTLFTSIPDEEAIWEYINTDENFYCPDGAESLIDLLCIERANVRENELLEKTVRFVTRVYIKHEYKINEYLNELNFELEGEAYDLVAFYYYLLAVKTGKQHYYNFYENMIMVQNHARLFALMFGSFNDFEQFETAYSDEYLNADSVKNIPRYKANGKYNIDFDPSFKRVVQKYNEELDYYINHSRDAFMDKVNELQKEFEDKGEPYDLEYIYNRAQQEIMELVDAKSAECQSRYEERSQEVISRWVKQTLIEHDCHCPVSYTSAQELLDLMPHGLHFCYLKNDLEHLSSFYSSTLLALIARVTETVRRKACQESFKEDIAFTFDFISPLSLYVLSVAVNKAAIEAVSETAEKICDPERAPLFFYDTFCNEEQVASLMSIPDYKIAHEKFASVMPDAIANNSFTDEMKEWALHLTHQVEVYRGVMANIDQVLTYGQNNLTNRNAITLPVMCEVMAFYSRYNFNQIRHDNEIGNLPEFIADFMKDGSVDDDDDAEFEELNSINEDLLLHLVQMGKDAEPLADEITITSDMLDIHAIYEKVKQQFAEDLGDDFNEVKYEEDLWDEANRRLVVNKDKERLVYLKRARFILNEKAQKLAEDAKNLISAAEATNIINSVNATSSSQGENVSESQSNKLAASESVVNSSDHNADESATNSDAKSADEQSAESAAAAGEVGSTVAGEVGSTVAGEVGSTAAGVSGSDAAGGAGSSAADDLIGEIAKKLGVTLQGSEDKVNADAAQSVIQAIVDAEADADAAQNELNDADEVIHQYEELISLRQTSSLDELDDELHNIDEALEDGNINEVLPDDAEELNHLSGEMGFEDDELLNDDDSLMGPDYEGFDEDDDSRLLDKGADGVAAMNNMIATQQLLYGKNSAKYLGENGFWPLMPGSSGHLSYLLGRAYSYGEFVSHNADLGYSSLLYSDLCGSYLGTVTFSHLYHSLFDTYFTTGGETYVAYCVRAVIAYLYGMQEIVCPDFKLNLFASPEIYDSDLDVNTYYKALYAQGDRFKELLDSNPAFNLDYDDESQKVVPISASSTVMANAVIAVCDFLNDMPKESGRYATTLINLLECITKRMRKEYAPDCCLAYYRFVTSRISASLVNQDRRFAKFVGSSFKGELLYNQLFPNSKIIDAFKGVISNNVRSQDEGAMFLQLGMIPTRMRDQGYSLLDNNLSGLYGNFLPVALPYLDEFYRQSAALQNGNSISYLTEVSRAVSDYDRADLYSLAGGSLLSIKNYRRLVQYYIKNEMHEERLALSTKMVMLRQPYAYYDMYLCLRENYERAEEAHTYLFFAARMNIAEAQNQLELLKNSGEFLPLPFIIHFSYLEKLAEKNLHALILMLVLSINGDLVPANFGDYIRLIERNHRFFSNSHLKRIFLEYGLINFNGYNTRLSAAAPNRWYHLFNDEGENLRQMDAVMDGNFAASHSLLELVDVLDAKYLSFKTMDPHVRDVVETIFDRLNEGKTDIERMVLFNWCRSSYFPDFLSSKASEALSKLITLEDITDATPIDFVGRAGCHSLDNLELNVYNNLALCHTKLGSHPIKDLPELDSTMEIILQHQLTPTTYNFIQCVALQAIHGYGRPHPNIFKEICRFMSNAGNTMATRFTHLNLNILSLKPYGLRYLNQYLRPKRNDMLCNVEFFETDNSSSLVKDIFNSQRNNVTEVAVEGFSKENSVVTLLKKESEQKGDDIISHSLAPIFESEINPQKQVTDSADNSANIKNSLNNATNSTNESGNKNIDGVLSSHSSLNDPHARERGHAIGMDAIVEANLNNGSWSVNSINEDAGDSLDSVENDALSSNYDENSVQANRARTHGVNRDGMHASSPSSTIADADSVLRQSENEHQAHAQAQDTAQAKAYAQAHAHDQSLERAHEPELRDDVVGSNALLDEVGVGEVIHHGQKYSGYKHELSDHVSHHESLKRNLEHEAQQSDEVDERDFVFERDENAESYLVELGDMEATMSVYRRFGFINRLRDEMHEDVAKVYAYRNLRREAVIELTSNRAKSLTVPAPYLISDSERKDILENRWRSYDLDVLPRVESELALYEFTKGLIDYHYFMLTNGHSLVQDVVYTRNLWQIGRKTGGKSRSYTSVLAKSVLRGDEGALNRYLYYTSSHYFKYCLNSNFFKIDESASIARKFVNEVLQLELDSAKFKEFAEDMAVEGFEEFSALVYEQENGYVPGRYRFVPENSTLDYKSGYVIPNNALLYNEDFEPTLDRESHHRQWVQEALDNGVTADAEKYVLENPDDIYAYADLYNLKGYADHNRVFFISTEDAIEARDSLKDIARQIDTVSSGKTYFERSAYLNPLRVEEQSITLKKLLMSDRVVNTAALYDAKIAAKSDEVDAKAVANLLGEDNLAILLDLYSPQSYVRLSYFNAEPLENIVNADKAHERAEESTLGIFGGLEYECEKKSTLSSSAHDMLRMLNYTCSILPSRLISALDKDSVEKLRGLKIGGYNILKSAGLNVPSGLKNLAKNKAKVLRGINGSRVNSALDNLSNSDKEDAQRAAYDDVKRTVLKQKFSDVLSQHYLNISDPIEINHDSLTDDDYAKPIKGNIARNKFTKENARYLREKITRKLEDSGVINTKPDHLIKGRMNLENNISGYYNNVVKPLGYDDKSVLIDESGINSSDQVKSEERLDRNDNLQILRDVRRVIGIGHRLSNSDIGFVSYDERLSRWDINREELLWSMEADYLRYSKEFSYMRSYESVYNTTGYTLDAVRMRLSSIKSDILNQKIEDIADRFADHHIAHDPSRASKERKELLRLRYIETLLVNLSHFIPSAFSENGIVDISKFAKTFAQNARRRDIRALSQGSLALESLRAKDSKALNLKNLKSKNTSISGVVDVLERFGKNYDQTTQQDNNAESSRHSGINAQQDRALTGLREAARNKEKLQAKSGDDFAKANTYEDGTLKDSSFSDHVSINLDEGSGEQLPSEVVIDQETLGVKNIMRRSVLDSDYSEIERNEMETYLMVSLNYGLIKKGNLYNKVDYTNYTLERAKFFKERQEKAAMEHNDDAFKDIAETLPGFSNVRAVAQMADAEMAGNDLEMNKADLNLMPDAIGAALNDAKLKQEQASAKAQASLISIEESYPIHEASVSVEETSDEPSYIRSYNANEEPTSNLRGDLSTNDDTISADTLDLDATNKSKVKANATVAASAASTDAAVATNAAHAATASASASAGTKSAAAAAQSDVAVAKSAAAGASERAAIAKRATVERAAVLGEHNKRAQDDSGFSMSHMGVVKDIIDDEEEHNAKFSHGSEHNAHIHDTVVHDAANDNGLFGRLTNFLYDKIGNNSGIAAENPDEEGEGATNPVAHAVGGGSGGAIGNISNDSLIMDNGEGPKLDFEIRDELYAKDSFASFVLEDCWSFEKQKERQYLRPEMFYEDENPLHNLIFMFLGHLKDNVPYGEALGVEDIFMNRLHSLGYYYGASDIVDSSFSHLIYEGYRRRFNRRSCEVENRMEMTKAASNIYLSQISESDLDKLFMLSPNDRTAETIRVCEGLHLPNDLTFDELNQFVLAAADNVTSFHNLYYRTLLLTTRAQAKHYALNLIDDSLVNIGLFDLYNDPALLLKAPTIQGLFLMKKVRENMLSSEEVDPKELAIIDEFKSAQLAFMNLSLFERFEDSIQRKKDALQKVSLDIESLRKCKYPVLGASEDYYELARLHEHREFLRETLLESHEYDLNVVPQKSNVVLSEEDLDLLDHDLMGVSDFESTDTGLTADYNSTAATEPDIEDTVFHGDDSSSHSTAAAAIGSAAADAAHAADASEPAIAGGVARAASETVMDVGPESAISDDGVSRINIAAETKKLREMLNSQAAADEAKNSMAMASLGDITMSGTSSQKGTGGFSGSKALNNGALDQTASHSLDGKDYSNMGYEDVVYDDASHGKNLYSREDRASSAQDNNIDRLAKYRAMSIKFVKMRDYLLNLGLNDVFYFPPFMAESIYIDNFNRPDLDNKQLTFMQQGSLGLGENNGYSPVMPPDDVLEAIRCLLPSHFYEKVEQGLKEIEAQKELAEEKASFEYDFTDEDINDFDYESFNEIDKENTGYVYSSDYNKDEQYDSTETSPDADMPVETMRALGPESQNENLNDDYDPDLDIDETKFFEDLDDVEANEDSSVSATALEEAAPYSVAHVAEGNYAHTDATDIDAASYDAALSKVTMSANNLVKATSSDVSERNAASESSSVGPNDNTLSKATPQPARNKVQGAYEQNTLNQDEATSEISTDLKCHDSSFEYTEKAVDRALDKSYVKDSGFKAYSVEDARTTNVVAHEATLEAVGLASYKAKSQSSRASNMNHFIDEHAKMLNSLNSEMTESYVEHAQKALDDRMLDTVEGYNLKEQMQGRIGTKRTPYPHSIERMSVDADTNHDDELTREEHLQDSGSPVYAPSDNLITLESQDHEIFDDEDNAELEAQLAEATKQYKEEHDLDDSSDIGVNGSGLNSKGSTKTPRSAKKLGKTVKAKAKSDLENAEVKKLNRKGGVNSSKESYTYPELIDNDELLDTDDLYKNIMDSNIEDEELLSPDQMTKVQAYLKSRNLDVYDINALANQFASDILDQAKRTGDEVNEDKVKGMSMHDVINMLMGNADDKDEAKSKKRTKSTKQAKVAKSPNAAHGSNDANVTEQNASANTDSANAAHEITTQDKQSLGSVADESAVSEPKKKSRVANLAKEVKKTLFKRKPKTAKDEDPSGNN